LSEAAAAFQSLAVLDDHQGLLEAATVVAADIRASIDGEQAADPGFRDLFERERASLHRWTEVR
jgi:hypothetical protein